MRTIGIMQGRLLPSIDGRIQAFPWNDWRLEFDLAQELDLGSIEFIFEGPNVDRHPLIDSAGRKQVKQAIRETDVDVGSICADHFMDRPLHTVSDAEAAENVDTLAELVEGAADVGIPTAYIAPPWLSMEASTPSFCRIILKVSASSSRVVE